MVTSSRGNPFSFSFRFLVPACFTVYVEDYSMVNSTFKYFPAIPISHSKDMVHWRIIGHAVTDPDYLDLQSIKDSPD